MTSADAKIHKRAIMAFLEGAPIVEMVSDDHWFTSESPSWKADSLFVIDDENVTYRMEHAMGNSVCYEMGRYNSSKAKRFVDVPSNKDEADDLFAQALTFHAGTKAEFEKTTAPIVSIKNERPMTTIKDLGILIIKTSHVLVNPMAEIEYYDVSAKSASKGRELLLSNCTLQNKANVNSLSRQLLQAGDVLVSSRVKFKNSIVVTAAVVENGAKLRATIGFYIIRTGSEELAYLVQHWMEKDENVEKMNRTSNEDGKRISIKRETIEQLKIPILSEEEISFFAEKKKVVDEITYFSEALLKNDVTNVLEAKTHDDLDKFRIKEKESE